MTAVTSPSSANSVHDLVRVRAMTEPEGTAVITAGIELSMREVISRADDVARRLRRAGVERGSVVGLALPRSPESIVAALGILNAGAACLPLDGAQPDERLRFMVADSRAVVVISDTARSGVWGQTPVLAADGTGEECVASSPYRVSADAAWVLYTSGSTGTPKGVVIGHGMVTARLQREPVPWASDDRCCHKTSLGFIDAIWEMFGPMVHGLPTVVADEQTARDPRLLARFAARHNVTRIVLVPSLLSALLELPASDLDALNGVRLWISSGEPLASALAERVYHRFPQTTLINLYGASECWDVTWFTVPRTISSHDSMPIGEPFSDIQVWVVDEALAPVAAGEPGELVVGGPCLAHGYLGLPDLTAARFASASPLGRPDGEIAYRTGDIVRRRPDGILELHGRRDLQVKLRGHRIELEEIERVMRASPMVRTAAVTPERDATGAVNRLVAYVTRAPGGGFNATRLRDEIAERLPAPFLPAIVEVSALPLTANGKLDRTQLAAWRAQPDVEARDAARDRAPSGEPRSGTQSALAAIWRDVLEVPYVCVDDDFFDLGGNSLLAINVAVRIHEDLAREVSIRDLYEQPTIALLSETLDGPAPSG